MAVDTGVIADAVMISILEGIVVCIENFEVQSKELNFRVQP